MFLASVVVLILLICVYNANNRIKELEKENKRLKQEILFMKNKQNEDVAVVESVNEEVSEKVQTQIPQKNVLKEKIPLSEKEKKRIALEKEKKEREARNTTILITGAILIVLSAIVFLMSTWYTIPNILKTSVLVLLIAVFFGGSKIAKEKFGLEKTSNTFFYMAMAYIPICLFSISILGLFGDFLSLTGDGRYIYLTMMGSVTALIYYVIYKQNNSKILFYGSILSQVFSVVLFSLIFDSRLEFISLNLLIYNLLFILLTSQKNNQLIKNIYAIIPYISTFMICIVFDKVTPLLPINFIVLAINYIILEILEKKKVYAYLFNIVLYSFGIYCIWRIDIHLNESVAVIFTLLYSIGVYSIQNVILFGKQKRNLKEACSVITLIMLEILFFSIYSYEESFIRPYTVSGIQCIILLISYIECKEFGKKLISYLFPVCFIITGIVFLNEMEATYHWYIIFSIITFILGELLKGKNVVILRNGFFVISHLLIAFTYIIVLFEEESRFIDDVIYFVILLVVYCYSYIKNKKSMFKYFGYMVSYLVLGSMCAFFDISEEFTFLIPTIILLVILNLEKRYIYLTDSGSKWLLAISKIIAYIYLAILGNEIGTIISIGLTAYFVYVCHKNKEKSYTCIIPLIGSMPCIFESALDENLMICIMLLTTIGITAVALKNKRISAYTIFSGIYLLLTLEELNTEYVGEILFTIWAIFNWYFVETNKEKDIFKFISYVGGLLLYNELAYDLDLTEYTAFSMLGYIAFAIGVIRTILNNYLKGEDIDVLEALTFACMYIFAINLYTSENDGMLFGILIVAILIVSYIKKYGMLFLTSTGAILLNVFLLTRAFWFSIPWWVYLLIIGSVLITFAVKNEANEKKDKISIGNALKKLKDNIEK